jgi:methylenetetrahydrofolate dehydrogenase (NADP+) / methenyltetrahydrofolate cyclohydrolase
MTATLIDGTAIAAKVRARVAAGAEELLTRTGKRPGLATILVGQNPASQAYVKSKHKACAEVGINAFANELPDTTSQTQLEDLLNQLNANPTVDGILLQLPLPAHLDDEPLLNLIRPDKDVDGFHPMNIGRLSLKGRQPAFDPCTPAGIMILLEEAGVQFEGARAVILGRSNIVGLPTALLLLNRNCTVTIAHSHTQHLPELCREADVLVAAVGRAQMVKVDWVKPGATVIDVGINRIEDASKKSGYRVVGDVDFEAVKEVAGAITPVPGGVGPLTIAMLMQNTLQSARTRAGLS